MESNCSGCRNDLWEEFPWHKWLFSTSVLLIFQVPFRPVPTVFKFCWHLFTHPLQTIGPIKIQDGEQAKSIAETGKKMEHQSNENEMVILTICNQSWKVPYQWRVQEEAVISCISCTQSVWLVGFFVHIKLWKTAQIHSSEAQRPG